MRKIYSFSLLIILFFLAGCSKDFLKRYDKRIVGTWRIADVNRVGIGGNPDKLPFTNGNFQFHEDGRLTYTSETNQSYEGNWEIEKKNLDDDTYRRLHISVVDFSTREIFTEDYDDMNFVSTNHFRAEIVSTFNTYVTHFRR